MPPAQQGAGVLKFRFVTQQAEYRPFKTGVKGSNPFRPTIGNLAEMVNAAD